MWRKINTCHKITALEITVHDRQNVTYDVPHHRRRRQANTMNEYKQQWVLLLLNFSQILKIHVFEFSNFLFYIDFCFSLSHPMSCIPRRLTRTFRIIGIHKIFSDFSHCFPWTILVYSRKWAQEENPKNSQKIYNFFKIFFISKRNFIEYFKTASTFIVFFCGEKIKV